LKDARGGVRRDQTVQVIESAIVSNTSRDLRGPAALAFGGIAFSTAAGIVALYA
jgi:hypothetical protein